MNSKVLVPFAMGAALLAGGCTNHFVSSQEVGVYAPVSAEQARIDARVLGSLAVLNKNEIAIAQVAKSRATHKSVKNYAEFMEQAHSRNLQEVDMISHKLGVMPEKGPVALMLQKKGARELASLKRLHGQAFDRAYMDAMVRGHEAALDLIDHKLLPHASHPQVRRQLEMTRASVVRHLKAARAVQKEIH